MTFYEWHMDANRREAAARGGVRILTIYDRPSDNPTKVVLRGRTVLPGGVMEVDRAALLFDRVDQARQLIPDGAVCLGREPGDEPQIVESWVL